MELKEDTVIIETRDELRQQLKEIVIKEKIDEYNKMIDANTNVIKNLQKKLLSVKLEIVRHKEYNEQYTKTIEQLLNGTYPFCSLMTTYTDNIN